MDTEGEALADVAYGLFEILLNMHLKGGGHFLFEQVESGEDFREEFNAAFLSFKEDYPDLSDALLAGYGSADAVYDLFCSGEGGMPRKTTRTKGGRSYAMPPAGGDWASRQRSPRQNRTLNPGTSGWSSTSIRQTGKMKMM